MTEPTSNAPSLPLATGALLSVVLSGALGVGCGQIDLERMIAQTSQRPFEPSAMFDDGLAMRTPPAGAVPRERVFAEGLSPVGPDGRDVEAVPRALAPTREAARALLVRGRDRFGIFCAPCHGAAGDGASEVAENMALVPPPSLHLPRIRAMPAGRIYRVVEHGWGLMPAYGDALDVRDRWAVVAYVELLGEEARRWLE